LSTAALLVTALVCQEPLSWEKDHAAALQRAREYRKPVLLYFRAATCKRSIALEADVWTAARAVAAAADFVPVWIDVDRDAARVKAKYGVRFTPTILFLARDGARLGEYEGKWEADAIAAHLEDLASRHRGPWAPGVEALLERARAARRLAIVVVWSDETEKAASRVNAVLGDTVTDYAFCLRAFGDESKKLADADRTWVVLDPLAEKPQESPLARIVVEKEAKAEDIRAELKKAREEFTRRHPK